jgi:hypothetical protein
MSVIAPEIWQQIESTHPAGDELIGRQAAPDITSRLLAALDSRGRRHLLILLKPSDDDFRDASSRGLTAQTAELTLRASECARYINIVCEDPVGHVMLDLVAGEIADRLRVSDHAPAEVVSRVLAKWRRFWGQLPRQLLSQEARTGLFAELWFLAYWLIPATGIADAVRMWRGPYGARHDFERAGLSVEAKGTGSTRGRIHKINGIQQMEAPEGGRLVFFSLRVRDEAGASNTLPLLVQACRDIVSVDPDAEGLFETGLITAGYLETHADEYGKTHWRVIEELLFDTGEDFPKIAAHTFAAGVPPGVEELDYTINLGTFDALVLARRPTDASALLAPATPEASP